MPTIHIDFESRGVKDLTKTGVHVYAADPQTDVWCAQIAVDDQPPILWRGLHDIEECPEIIEKAVRDGYDFVAHNAAFERVMWNLLLVPRYGWPEPPLERWRCTMAMALAMAIPASLENAASAMGMDLGKDMQGRRLMLQMAKPRSIKDGIPTWWDDEARRKRLYAYCATDVEVERGLAKRLLALTPSEQRIWQLDARINDRGIQVDVDLCNAASKIVAEHTETLNAEMEDVTYGFVSRVTNTNELVAFCNDNGIDGDSVRKDEVIRLLARDDLPASVRRALEIRQEGGKASVSKIKALLTGMEEDGRARGLLQYHAASTGRWGGRRYQPQNLRKPDDGESVAGEIDAVMTGDVEFIQMTYGDPLTVVGDCIRGMVRAAPGKLLYAADLSNIEGRVVSWLAGEEKILEDFRKFDRKEGPDLYKIMAASIYRCAIADVTDKMRSAGKIAVLALGFLGGAGALLRMARAYKLNLAELYDGLVEVSGAALEEAERAWATRGKGMGYEKRPWLAAEIIKILFRQERSLLVQFGRELDRAAIEAAESGNLVRCGRLAFIRRGSFLFMRLPSGRALCYPYPRVMKIKTPWLTDEGDPVFKKALTYKTTPNMTNRHQIVDEPGNTHNWARLAINQSVLLNNGTQGTARDVMVEGMIRHEAAGYPIVLTVHDEVVSERDGGDLDEFISLLATNPEWAPDLPIAAAGWRGPRYRK